MVPAHPGAIIQEYLYFGRSGTFSQTQPHIEAPFYLCVLGHVLLSHSIEPKLSQYGIETSSNGHSHSMSLECDSGSKVEDKHSDKIVLPTSSTTLHQTYRDSCQSSTDDIPSTKHPIVQDDVTGNSHNSYQNSVINYMYNTCIATELDDAICTCERRESVDMTTRMSRVVYLH